ncbi:MAG: peptidoglycan DD-metalloendopeptidase family protein [Candidatus Omnitrophota bacterium]|nr:peptidoglycan DD-metalloendopeptidase family protein [Candidatus Omnitrophota bacterium]MBU2527791.1 peptidoglycan DD-metalloendopeptidase family protein [bacterium]MBU3930409.1 peptidoglycan DD-metalloendopeptidase family protein [bacterium]MBU4123260.1 peptidoglycan DD-metalloendopeptidase family protein [bacterium]
MFFDSFRQNSREGLCCVVIILLAGCIPPPAGHNWYYVRRGDTLWSIARKNKTDFFSLVNANDIQNPSRIYPGMKLKVPAEESAVSAKSPAASKKRQRASKPAQSADVSFSWPVKGKIVEHFGKIDLVRSLGIVIKADSPAVKASASGIVSFCGEAGNFGDTVIIKHAGGYHSVYAYLDSVSVKTGDTVASGALVGNCGSSKKHGGRVLYFEIRFGTEAYDPMMYLN